MLITADDYLPIARRFEGEILWLYLDVVNLVTIGIGHMIPNVAALDAIPLMKGDRPATPQEKSAAFAAVAAATDRAPRGAGAFKDLTDLRITSGQSADLFKGKFESMFADAVDRFADVNGGFANWSKSVQLATFDMAYNLGVSGLYNGYPNFRKKGLAVPDYTVCAQECYRNGPGPARNDWTKQQFLVAAGKAS